MSRKAPKFIYIMYPRLKYSPWKYIFVCAKGRFVRGVENTEFADYVRLAIGWIFPGRRSKSIDSSQKQEDLFNSFLHERESRSNTAYYFVFFSVYLPQNSTSHDEQTVRSPILRVDSPLSVLLAFFLLLLLLFFSLFSDGVLSFYV